MRLVVFELVRFCRRIAFRSRRGKLERELAEEIEFHRSLKETANGEAGFCGAEAELLSRREMGNMALAKEVSRESWSFLAVERLMQDLRYAGRILRRSPGFTAITALSIAIGIGGNAAVFSLVNAMLIRPLPYPAPDRLVRITDAFPKAALDIFRNESRTMEVASISPGFEFNLMGQGEAVRLFGSSTSANLFSVLRASPKLGRVFEPGEDRPGRDGVVILGHSLWKERFSADPQIIGRAIELNGVERRIVGVMPAAFSYPSAGVQFWIPSRVDPSIFIDDYWGGEFTPLVARLRDGANIAQAGSEVASLVRKIRQGFPFPMKRDWNADSVVIPLQEDVVGDVRGKLLILFSSVGVVLLIACANVASLLLSRATVRRKEIALRTALGAGRGRILRQLLTESVLLSMTGAALGLLLGKTALSIFRSVLPQDTPGLAGAAIDFQVVAFVAGLAVLTGLLFGIAPALSAAQIDLTEAIKTGSQRATSYRWTQLRSCLIGAEVALTAVLVIGAGLLVRTLYVLTKVDPGFSTDHILAVRITPNQSLCRQRAACIALYEQMIEEARGISGVSSAAIASSLPLDGRYAGSLVAVDLEDHPKTPSFPAPMFLAEAVTPGCLEMLHVPLLAGRRLRETDGPNSAPSILISASTARRFWPAKNAIGKHIKTTSEQEWRTVVGVVGDVRQYDLTGTAPDWIEGTVYMPYAQSVLGDRQIPAAMNLVARTASDPTRIGTELRRLAVARNPNVPVSRVETLEAVVSTSTTVRHSTMYVFISFAFAAITLAAIGIFGLVSHSVSQRTYEIGVRIAVGATPTNILTLFLAQSMWVGGWGVFAGIFTAFLLTRFLSGLLYGVGAADPITFIVVGLLLLVVAMTASCLPAWKASRLSSTKSLRVD